MDLRQRSAVPVANVSFRDTASKQNKRKNGANHRSNRSIGVVIVAVGGLLLLVAMAGMMILHRNEHSSVPSIRQNNRTLKKDGDDDEERAKLIERIRQLEVQVETAKQQKQPSTSNEKVMKHNQKSRIHTKQAIKALSKRLLMEKYGVGPHFIEMNVSFDPNSNIYSDSIPFGSIILELAPISQMPAIDFWFLEQINHTLYDGASFHRNAGHVLQAGPVANFETPVNANLMQRFRESGLEGVPFQEYSPSFPHKQYTVGYAGRPGGPDFYISTKDNSRVHGPGGQQDYDDPSEADPCFAKVVAGFDLVKHMEQSRVQPGGYRRMEHYVSIRTMRLIPEQVAKDHIEHESLTVSDMADK